jgi:predicted unusual protein kinase regulating ubiquinone biosynthesis (AarF/ABC1/UbiB family)
MASYIDGIVPEAHQEAYQTALRGLRAASPTSSPDKIRALIEDELKAPIESLFAEFEDTPFASASIGQVHRARLFDGREVAVKAQHPGIARAVESDLENAGVIESLVGFIGPRALDTGSLFDEIRERFREELDYRLEAERQRIFRTLHDEDPSISIPRVIDDRSSARVLTSELARGESLEVAATRSERERRMHAETLWRFVFKGTLVGGFFNADPHPGNYLFQTEGKVTFLDFGCVQPIELEKRLPARRMHTGAILRDQARFEEGARALLRTRGGSFERAALAYVRRCFDPLFGSPFRITPEYVTEIVVGIRAMKAEIFAKDGSFVMPSPGMAFMNRLQFGFYSVLARLDVEADYAAVERRFLEADGETFV